MAHPFSTKPRAIASFPNNSLHSVTDILRTLYNFTARCAQDVENAELIYHFTFCQPAAAEVMARQGGQKVKTNSPSGKIVLN
jgi:hypothetical protein